MISTASSFRNNETAEAELLRDVAEHRELGDVTTLADPSVVSLIDEHMRRPETTTTRNTASRL